MTTETAQTTGITPQCPEDCDVVVAPSYAQAKNWSQAHRSQGGHGRFGSIAQTFPAWIESLWELYGNGCRLVDDTERAVVARTVAAALPKTHLADTPNLSAALARCARHGLGIPSFDAAVDAAMAGNPAQMPANAAAALSAAEWEFLASVGRYRDALDAAGLIEQGSALTWLAAHADEVFCAPVSVWVLDGAPLPPAAVRFLGQGGPLSVRLPRAQQPTALAPIDRAQVRFAFPAGRYAQAPVVLQAIGAICNACPGQPVVVCAKDPLALYRALAPALDRQGIGVAVRARIPFLATDFGRAYAALSRALAPEVPWNRDALSDVLHSAFLNLDKAHVWQLDRTLRGDRLTDRAAFLARLRGPDPAAARPWQRAFRLLEALVTRSAPADLTACKQRYRLMAADSDSVDFAFVAEQCAAIDALGDLLDAQARLSGDAADTLLLLGAVSVSASRSTRPAQAGSAPQVRVLSQEQAAELAPGSVAGLIVCDLTSVDYPLSDKRSAVDLLLDKLGAAPNAESPLARARRGFTSLTRAPHHLLVLERRLNDEAAGELYPSAMWEEFVDAYRDPAARDAGDDLDRDYLLPACLMDQRLDAGEDDVFQDVRPGLSADLSDSLAQPVPQRARVSVHRDDLVFPNPLQDPTHDLPRLSPSQLDAYLDCPYCWFATRGLSTTALDEDFGPAGRGTFMHQVFQDFYRAFGRKVTPENLADARRLMFGHEDVPGIFDAVAAAQPLQAPGMRYPALAGTTEMREIDSLRQLADGWLSFETAFLPGYTPCAFEYPVDFEYAGCRITGRIDRVDTDGQGHVAVIDYKGTLKTAFRACYKGRKKTDPLIFRPDGKVQGLVYAAALQQAGELRIPAACGFADQDEAVRCVPVDQVVGVLYVSYRKGNTVTGAFRETALGPADLLTLEVKEGCGLPASGPLSFDALQQHVEQRAADAVAGICAAQVEPCPATKDACTYCPIATCEERR